MALDLRLAVVVLISAFCLQHLMDGSAVSWSYVRNGEHGPQKWKENFPDCGGMMQSPIDIDTSHVLYDPDLKYFNTEDYAKTDGVQMSLHNVGGHTAEVMYHGSPLYLRGGNLPDIYQVDQFHFHWGKEDHRGSEHSVDKKHFPLEMHIVHHQKHLDNVTVAMSHPYGLAVVGFFFKVGTENPYFEPMLRHFDEILMPGNSTDIPSLKLSSLLPNVTKLDYYRYMGSLTTPPCYETVIWSLATTPIELSHAQIEKFRMLYADKTKHLQDDYRPVQDRHARTVTTTVDMGNASGSDHPNICQTLLLGAFPLIAHVTLQLLNKVIEYSLR